MATPHFIFTNTAKLSSISKKKGNIIMVNDGSELYIDFSTTTRVRIGVGDPLGKLGIQTQLDAKAPKNHTHPYVTGFSVNGTKVTYTLGDGTTGSFTTQDTNTNTTYSAMTGATASAAGKEGLVPAPGAGAQAKFLRGDGTWQVPYTHPTSAGNKHIPSGGSSGQLLGYSSAGTAAWKSTIDIGRKSGTTTGTSSTAEGYDATASGKYAHAEGKSSTASATASHAEGSGTISGDTASHAEGVCTWAGGYASHAEGGGNTISAEVLALTTGGALKTAWDSSKFLCAYGWYSHSEGSDCLACGSSSHAEGLQTYAGGSRAHAEGSGCVAGGTSSHAEGEFTTASGEYSHSEGYHVTASGMYSHAEGGYTNASGQYAHAEGYYTTASSLASHVGGKYNKAMTDCTNYATTKGDCFVLGKGTGPSARANAFRVTYEGAVYGLSAFNSSGADYAEFTKPWWDGNLDKEDRVGLMVTIKDERLYKANDGDYIVGITSGNPSVVGNADEDYYWRYERDEFNRFVWEDVEEEVVKLDEEGNEVLDENGNPVMVKTGKIFEKSRMKLADDYDPSKQNDYVERKDRPEWDYVGMIGVLPVRDDGTCEPGGFCKCSKDGIATKATQRGFDTFFVIERITENVVSVEMR